MVMGTVILHDLVRENALSQKYKIQRQNSFSAQQLKPALQLFRQPTFSITLIKENE